MRKAGVLLSTPQRGFRIPLITVGILSVSWPFCLHAQLAPCPDISDPQRITEALTRIERSTDPCGESAQVAALLKQLTHCSASTYRICTNSQIDRSIFDRPIGDSGKALPRTITWNPELRSELEPSCDGDSTAPVLRDPTASLLHELAHAVQDCAGLNPDEHELEAVQIENIYRRAAGLCQRSRYGDQALPAPMVRICGADTCPCSSPGNDPGVYRVAGHDARSLQTSGTHSAATFVGDPAE